jgi:hypothetical protein
MHHIGSVIRKRVTSSLILIGGVALSTHIPTKGERIMAKTASNKAGAAQSTTVWTTVQFSSAEGKALKARLTAANAEAKEAKADIEALALSVLPAAPKGFEIVFSHRFGLGYAVVPLSTDKPAVKAKSGPAI